MPSESDSPLEIHGKISLNSEIEALKAWQNRFIAQLMSDDVSNRGEGVYQRSIEANASRALQISFPVVFQLIGDALFYQLAQQFWRISPPSSGDWACWGEVFPEFLASAAVLEEYSYISDCAKLDWCVHVSERATDDACDVAALNLLSTEDPYTLQLVLSESTAIANSLFPIAEIFNAHQVVEASERDPSFVYAKQLMTQGKGQAVLIWRHGFRVEVNVLSSQEFEWYEKVLSGATLGELLDDGGINFTEWLPWAVTHHVLRQVRLVG